MSELSGLLARFPALFVVSAAWLVSRAEAQVVQVEARSKRAIAATHGEDPTASGSSLDLTDRVTLPRSLSDVLREAAGAQVISTGGIGAFSALSLRGAGAEETLVLLDEIPLSTADGGAFDLSLFPVELYARANVFRGGAPVWLGSGAIGGVLQLVPHRAERNRANAWLGAGSFGTYQFGGGTEVALPSGLSARSQLIVRGTRGDYPYLDDRGTRFDASDDQTFRLKNAELVEASGLQDLSVPLWGGTLHVLALGLVRSGGFPGPAAQPTPKIERESTRAILAGAYSIERGDEASFGRRLQIVASGAYEADRFRDVYGQLGTSNQSDRANRNFRAFVRGGGSLYLARWLEATLVSSYAYDAYLPFDSYAFPTPRRSERHTGAAALELAAKAALGPVRFELRPSARIERSQIDLHAPMNFTRGYQSEQGVTAPTARIGGVVAPHPSLALSGSVATGTRLPTMFELFGDGGVVLPSVDLEPVKSTTYDGGITLRGRAGPVRGRAELRGFWQERRDAIAMFRTAQYQVGHENLSSVRQWGSESSLTGSITRFFALAGSFTWLNTESALKKRLPFRPRYLGYVRPELRLSFDHDWVSGASVASELWHRSFAFVDPANLAYTDACTKLAWSAALSLFRERVRISARVDDSLDARCTDLVGYPLPGRSLFFSLSYREVDHDAS